MLLAKRIEQSHLCNSQLVKYFNNKQRGNKVRLDICARRFCEAGQIAKIFNPNTIRYIKLEFSKTYRINEKEKKKLTMKA